MSVRVSDRGEGKLEALVHARLLAVYTIKVTDNQKKFDPLHRVFIDKMQNAASDIFIHANAANCIYVKSKADADQRSKLQGDSIAKCYELLGLLNIAHGLFHIEGKRVKYWAEMVITTRDKLKSWRESDIKRYQSF